MREIPAGDSRLLFEEELPSLTPEEAFAYWTSPELLCRWWPQQAQVEPRPGGSYLLAWPQMGWLLRGRVAEIEPGCRLSFTWAWDHEPGAPPTLVQVAFEPAPGGGTRMRIEHGPFDALEDGGSRAQIRDGWVHFVSRLREAAGER